MKKTKSSKKVKGGAPMWLMALLVIALVVVVFAFTKLRDSRSSADDGVEAGVVLPVASDKE